MSYHPMSTGAAPTVDDAREGRIARPIRRTKPTAALLQHSEKAVLPSQTKAINDFHAAEAAKRIAEHAPTPTLPSSTDPTKPVPDLPVPVLPVGRQERDLAKRAKIDFLQLSEVEWTRVGQFADILSVRSFLYIRSLLIIICIVRGCCPTGILI